MNTDYNCNFHDLTAALLQLSSYANMLISEKLFNVESYLPSKAVLENVRAFFENVSMPVLSEQRANSCSVEVLESSL